MTIKIQPSVADLRTPTTLLSSSPLSSLLPFLHLLSQGGSRRNHLALLGEAATVQILVEQARTEESQSLQPQEEVEVAASREKLQEPFQQL